MTDTEDADERLRARAADFASQLTSTIRAVVGDHVDAFTAIGKHQDGTTGLAIRQQPREGITLCVDQVPMLDLKVSMRCAWDHRFMYLAVEESRIVVSALAGSSEPLFRFDYLRDPRSADVPGAHIQVHAHRDAITYVMARCGTGSRRARRRSMGNEEGRNVPRLSELHFPVGGQRFRPCLEDVLQMLIEELGVDACPGAQEALAEGRERWRLDQVGACVRDSPETAARVLRELGYDVQAPSDGPPADKRDKLRLY